MCKPRMSIFSLIFEIFLVVELQSKKPISDNPGHNILRQQRDRDDALPFEKMRFHLSTKNSIPKPPHPTQSPSFYRIYLNRLTKACGRHKTSNLFILFISACKCENKLKYPIGNRVKVRAEI